MSLYQKDDKQVEKKLFEWSFAIKSKIQINSKIPIILVGTHLDCLFGSTNEEKEGKMSLYNN